MVIELIWISISTLLIAFLLWRFTPVEHIRKAMLSFLAMLTVTWSLGAVVTELHLMVHPVRLFPEATRMNLFAGFIIYPSINALYILHYPNKSRMTQFLYTSMYALVITLWVHGMERFTDLEKYVQWSTIHQFVITFFALGLSRSFLQWFFKKPFPSVRNGG